MSTPSPVVRVYRVGTRGSLLLHDGQQLLDLSDHLLRTGQPNDLVELAESGWFDESLLKERLANAEEWEPVELTFDGNAPKGVRSPIDPKSVGKVLALGKNFHAHAEEFGEQVPEEPLFFNKLPETIVGHHAEVVVPSWYTQRVDHEAELAVVIGLAGKDIEIEDAMEHVAGFTVANDLTARSLQGQDRDKKYPWFRAKNMDSFLPLGPAFVPRGFLEVDQLDLTCDVNGERRQEASTRQLVVDVPHAIAYLSRHLSLNPGDLILMGTPSGVGPLKDGDEVVCGISGIGSLRTTIARPGAEA